MWATLLHYVACAFFKAKLKIIRRHFHTAALWFTPSLYPHPLTRLTITLLPIATLSYRQTHHPNLRRLLCLNLASLAITTFTNCRHWSTATTPYFWFIHRHSAVARCSSAQRFQTPLPVASIPCTLSPSISFLHNYRHPIAYPPLLWLSNEKPTFRPDHFR